MLGNAMEYVLETEAAPKDGKWFASGRPVGILMGGSWNDKAAALTSGSRQRIEFKWNERDPNRPRSIVWHYDGPWTGIRLARSVE